MAVFALALVALGSGRVAGAQDTQAPQAAHEQAVAALYRCFWQALSPAESSAGADEQTEAVGPTLTHSPAAELYFWHQLGEASRELGGRPELSWCEPYFVAPLRRAHAQAQALPSAAKGEHALLARAQALGASRRQGMAERVVSAALRLPPAARWGLDAAETQYVVACAQTLETHLFLHPRWHAHSEAKALRPNAQEAHQSQQRFVAQAIAVARAARRAADGDEALLHVGLLAALVLDLHVHRGLSRPEAAALHVRHAPFGQAKKASELDEQRVALDVAEVWEAALGVTGPARARWSAPKAAAIAACPHTQAAVALQARVDDVSPLRGEHLWRQMRQASAFAQLNAEGAPPVGAGHWSVPHTQAAIVAGLRANDGGAASRDAPWLPRPDSNQ